MSLKPQPIGSIPELTAFVARAAFPDGNPCMSLRDTLGTFYDEDRFAGLFPDRGRPGETPWRLALVTVLQYAEGLTDRQAADAVRSRIDWKYLLGLELTDPGFDFSVLCEFRARLVTGGAERLLLEAMLESCIAHGLVKARAQQRTDSTHVRAAIRTLNRLELVGETLRAALNSLATVAPQWLRSWVPPAWFDRYAARVEESRLPKGEAARYAHGEAIGADGFQLLDTVYGPTTPAWLSQIPAVEIRVATRLLRFYALRELASGLDHRGVPISFPTRFGALEQGKASRNGSALRKGHLEFFRAYMDQESQSIS